MKRKASQITTTKTFFFFLPDDVFLILLEYCGKEDIEATREFQSKWVRHCTQNVLMSDAIHENNFDNIKWIMRPHEGTSSTVF